MKGLSTVFIGAIFIVGGLTGELALIGTNSGVALAVVGFFMVIFGIARLLSPTK